MKNQGNTDRQSSITPEGINTLYQLAEYINSDDYNQIKVNKAIEKNGWYDTSHVSDYDVCAYGSDKVVLNPDTGIAEVVSLAQEARVSVGRQIREERKRKGLTLQELAGRCDVTYQNIAKIEAAKYSVGVDVLARIANALGINLMI